MKAKRDLVVALIGPVPCWGMPQIKKNLSSHCSFRLFPKLSEDGVLLKKLAGVDVALAQFFTERMAAAAKDLQLLLATGAGVNDFCLRALHKDTTVANVYFHGPAIAEYVMMTALVLNRDLMEVDSHFRRGSWNRSWVWGDDTVDEIQGKTLGLIGFGHIGKEVAARARAFGMKVRALSAHPPAGTPDGLESLSGPEGLKELLRASDFLVLACPLNDRTRGLIGKREFGWMKRSACLINIARAAIVDESALYRALRQRRIKGAALDVWYRYPVGKKRFTPSQYPFHKLPNIIMTPHVAGWTTHTFAERFRTIAENIDRLAYGQALLNVVHGPKSHKASLLPDGCGNSTSTSALSATTDRRYEPATLDPKLALDAGGDVRHL